MMNNISFSETVFSKEEAYKAVDTLYSMLSLKYKEPK